MAKNENVIGVSDVLGYIGKGVSDITGATQAEQNALAEMAETEQAIIQAESSRETLYIVGGIVAAALIGAAFIFRR